MNWAARAADRLVGLFHGFDKRHRRNCRADRQLLIDVSTIIQHDARTGIQRVVRAVWLQLQAMDLDGVTIRPVYATTKRRYCYADPEFLDSGGRAARAQPVQITRDDIFLGLDLAAHRVWRYRRQIARWKRKGATIHFVVYDMLPLRLPDWFPPSTGRNFQRWMQVIEHCADQAICISATVADDLYQWLGGTSPRAAIAISTVALSGDLAGSAPSHGLDEEGLAVVQAMTGRPTVLMVGTIEPRKAHARALDAMEWLWRNGRPVQFVIAGRPGWHTEDLQRRFSQHPDKGDMLFWLPDASDELLLQLYTHAALVLAPSYAEGFGLPVIEALNQGCKVLARDLPVFRELSRDGLYFFASDDPEALGIAIRDLVHAPQPAPPAQAPGWDNTARGIAAALGLISQ